MDDVSPPFATSEEILDWFAQTNGALRAQLLGISGGAYAAPLWEAYRDLLRALAHLEVTFLQHLAVVFDEDCAYFAAQAKTKDAARG